MTHAQGVHQGRLPWVGNSGDASVQRASWAGTGQNFKGPAGLLACSGLQMKTLDSDNGRLGRELAELQSRLALGERTEKESRREVLGLRQKVLKGESSLEALKQEVTEEFGCAGQRRMGYCMPAFPPEGRAEPTAPETLSCIPTNN